MHTRAVGLATVEGFFPHVPAALGAGEGQWSWGDHSEASPPDSREPQKGSVNTLAGMLRSLKFNFISQDMQALQSLPSHVVLFMHGWENSVDERCCLQPDFGSWPGCELERRAG